MKKTLLCIASALMLTMPTFAQSNNNVDQVVKIEKHAAQDYRPGEMIVKFKATSPVRVKAMGKKLTSGVNQVDRVFSELGITAGEQLMPLTGGKSANRTKALKSVTGQIIPDADMTLLYRLQFDPKQMDVLQAIEKVKALDEVEYAEPNYLVYALSSDDGVLHHHDDFDHYCKEPLYPEQWGHHPLKTPFLWQQPKITDKRPVIAILDTGVDIEHPDLKDNIWTNTAESEGAEGEDDDNNGFADDLHGWDFVNKTARMGDWNGHGTHCAGIAAAVGNNGKGITGANPDALIMPVTVMQSSGTGDVATIIKGIDYAAANGADIISMSIGGYGYSIAQEQALAKAYSKAVLVAAAGNDCMVIGPPNSPSGKCPVCQEPGRPMFPAAFTFVLGVEASVEGGNRAIFSNSDLDGPVFSYYNEEQLYNYELRAPGYSIMSTFPGGKYKKLNGTSMACPFVAGGLSRLLQVKEYSNWEILFGDLIHTRKCNGWGDVDFEAAFKITDEDRKPTLGLVTYVLKDTIQGDGDGRPDAGETIAFYPTLRNEWGQAKNIRFSLEVAETEDPTIIEVLDSVVDFGKPLSSYGKNISANPLRFKVREDCADGRHICLVLRATCDNIAEELVHEFTITAENGVEIGGMITEDLTLYPNVHYIVTKSLAIPEGVTLTIQPGTILKFKDDTGMSCKGNLICQGTPDNLIVFTKADFGLGNLSSFNLYGNTLEYSKFENISFPGISEGKIVNCLFSNIVGEVFGIFDGNCRILSTNLYYINLGIFYPNSNAPANSFLNIVGNQFYYTDNMPHDIQNSNVIGNSANGKPYFLRYSTSEPAIYTQSSPNYFGTTLERIVRLGLYDFEHPTSSTGFGIYDLSNMLTRPVAEAHAIVWKVVVNGYDAQDEFEQLPPLGVGKHKFEVYFSRPMDKSFTPMIAMGVCPPYTQNTIAEEGSWNEDGTIYTAYLTITGKTGADGLNRIYVADAVESSEDYYLRRDLDQMRSNTQELLGYREPQLQTDNPSAQGYVKCSSGTAYDKNLVDGNLSTWTSVISSGYFTIDLGDDIQEQFVRFNVTSDDYSLKTITIQGSHDGNTFNDVYTYAHTFESLTGVSSNIGPRYSFTTPIIDAGESYRYYRLKFSSNSGYKMYESGMECFNSAEEINDFDYYKERISVAKELCQTGCRDFVKLRTALGQMYEAYNKLATAKGEPTIVQQPVEVPSTPMWKIPVENMRFNVQVEAAGSMATGLMAEAGLGKVKLTWETDEEDFTDLLGYNIYRYTEVDDSVSVRDYNKYGDYNYHWEYFTRMDTTIVNPNVLEADETAFTDYDVIPGATYYYFIKQLTTSLTSHALSNAVAATPLTAQKGDANGSMNVDIADVVTEVAYITYQDPQPFIFEAADVNSDEKVNVLDVVGTIGIITNPTQTGINAMDDTPVHYYVQDGVLYMENAQPLGGVQVYVNADKGTEIKVLDALKDMEQTSTWVADNEFLFMAYSMSGRTLAPGTHALLEIGKTSCVTEVILSDAKGHNVMAINGNATGIGKVEAMQMQIPTPNPFTTMLKVPYVIGQDGNHNVSLVFTDMAGRTLDAYHTTVGKGVYTYTWYPEGLTQGLYLVSMYVDGKLMQTAKVICAGK